MLMKPNKEQVPAPSLSMIMLVINNSTKETTEIYQSKESALKFGSDEPICFYYNKNTQTLQYGTPVDVVSILPVMTRLQRSNMNARNTYLPGTQPAKIA